MAGFFLLSANKNIIAFPFSLVVGIIIFFTIISNVRDIKDEVGDRALGIKTLPVLLGEKNYKIIRRIITGVCCASFLVIPWYFHIALLIAPSIITSILCWYFSTRENYKEWKIFAVYLTYLIIVIVAIAFK
jgi:4-hydroxybenzoate polyprenyltransferase